MFENLEPLIDAIYDAPFHPSRWPNVLADICAVSGSAAALCGMMEDASSIRFHATDLIRPAMEDIDLKDQWKESGLIRALFKSGLPHGLVRETDFFPTTVIEADSIKRDRVKSLGIGVALWAMTRPSDHEIIFITLDRWADEEQVSADDMAVLNHLLPHLVRTAHITSRLRLQRARANVTMLANLGLPAAVIAANGTALAVNSLLQDLPQVLTHEGSGRLKMVDPEANRLYVETVDGYRTRRYRAVSSIPARNFSPDQPPYVTHLLPVRRATTNSATGGDLVVTVTRVDPAAGSYPPSILIGLFDLTPAEARLAVQLAEGKTLTEAAETLSLTVKTARTYLDRLFTKTGAHRQSELIGMIKSTTVLNGVNRPTADA